MKATGIVRRIDDLGRVVIPKEIRRTMRIREGTPLEIYTGVSGEVIFKKYSPVGELSNFAEDYAEALFKATDFTVLICDEDNIIAAAGPLKKELFKAPITEEIADLLKSRTRYTGGEKPPVLNGAVCSAVYPIISCGDVGGAVILADKNGQKAAESDLKLLLSAVEFLGRQLED